MKDVNGNELQIGDYVVYSSSGKNNRAARIQTGCITNIYSHGREEECTVAGCTHISSLRVLKIAAIPVNFPDTGSID